MNTTSQKQKVRQYFDSIAGNYANRKNKGNKYYRYFFGSRLAAATHGISFEGKKILDVGAGTGELYNWLKTHTENFHYFGTDISPAMLTASNIPAHARYCGDLQEAPLPYTDFDFIFLLGVTTYIPRKELPKLLAFLSSRLTKNGKLIVSFTHRCSVDFRFRRLLKISNLSKWFPGAKKRMINQSFKTEAYCIGEINSLSKNLSVGPPIWLNQTCSPFNQLFPSFSVWFAGILQKHLPSKWLPLASADYLIVLTNA